jgi:hypothetical protein
MLLYCEGKKRRRNIMEWVMGLGFNVMLLQID